MPFDSLPEVIETPLTETQRALLRAADLIEHKGLAKHIREDNRGQLCVHGAIDLAVNGTSSWDFDEYTYNDGAAIDALTDFLKAKYGFESPGYRFPETGPTHHTATGWNNAPERTQAEVVAALRGAAAACGKVDA